MPREIALAYPEDRRSWLRRSMEDYHKLRWSVIVPSVLSFAAVFVVLGWPLLFGAGSLLAKVLAIHPEEAVRDQPNGLPWLVAFLVAGVLIMLLVYAVWCAIATAWLVVARDWPRTDAYNAIVQCRYPNHWIKLGAQPPA
jgi:hypothetical protein